MLCNPEAIFRYLVDHPDYRHLTHVWALSGADSEARLAAEFGANPRVTSVRRGGPAYWRVLSTAGYLINNSTFPAAFGKREGQTYLNTWHGTPLKHMGFDMPNGAVESANTLRNLLSADYLLAANPFMAETMYEGAYRLINVYQGQLIEEGYPRIDRQNLDAAQREAVRAELAAAGIRCEADTRLVLYAPTWRGASFATPEAGLDDLAQHTAALQDALGPGTLVLLKTHQVVHALAASTPSLRGILVPNTIPTNVMLGLADGLVTDYSSIFFDFLATGHPIAFLTPDADDYDAVRGTYMPLDELPGPVSTDARQTGEALRRLMDADGAHPRYAPWAERFVSFEDGHATERIVDIVFGGAREGYRVRPARNDGRIRVMFSLGGMRPNGITTSALNLLAGIDATRYDVTAAVTLAALEGAEAHTVIPENVRQVLRIGGMNGSKAVQVRRRLSNRRAAVPEYGSSPWHERLWDDEWARVFGTAQFDWVADFSGYDPFWANLTLHAPGAAHAIWQHNEMAPERLKTIDGKQRHKRNLGAIFAMYGAFDQIVAVSPRLTARNREQLAEYAPADRFMTLRNLPNVERVRAGLARPLSSIVAPGATVPPWLALLEAHSRGEGGPWFVTIGRLSPEKNHARLIRAFAGVVAEVPGAKLIIVGEGPLEAELAAQIADGGLGDAVFLAGQQANPFPIVAASDCFVLSSLYEGQPMVLMEAAECGVPIVSTAFASVDDALPPGAIRVVAQDDDALRVGLLAAARGEVPASHLDAEDYSAEVMAELDALVQVGIARARVRD